MFWRCWCVSIFAMYCISTSQFPNHTVLTFRLTEANYHNYSWRIVTGILHRNFTSWPDTDLASLNVTRQLPIQVYVATHVWIFPCFPAHSSVHSADKFRAFVLSSFAFCSYTKPSPVSTDHDFCCFGLWTHRLLREIQLWVKEWNKCLMTIDFPSIL